MCGIIHVYIHSGSELWSSSHIAACILKRVATQENVHKNLGSLALTP